MAKSVLGSETYDNEGTQSQSNFIEAGPSGGRGGGGGGGGGGRKGAPGKQEGGQATGPGATGAGGNVTQVQKVDMTKEQKRVFMGEIKVELREMIN